MAKYKVREKLSQRIPMGGALVQVEDFVNQDQAQHLREGDIIILQDAKKEFLGKLLVGRQNKGLGWVFTRDEYEFWDRDLFMDRLTQAVDQRQNLMDDPQTNAFRIFNGEGDGIGGITVDWYNQYLQVNIYSQGIHQSLEDFLDCLEALDLPILGIYVTLRYKNHGQENSIYLARGSHAPQPHIVLENGIEYAVYLGEDWMTGIFLDQREVRQFIQNQSDQLSLLNLFSYTGAFSLAAAMGGGTKTVSVDVANRSLERTREQFALNGIDPDNHQVRIMDVFDYLDYAQRHQLKFDMIVCDPPSFARSKKRIFAADKDYEDLARQIFHLAEPGGYLIFSTNHSGYSLNDFRQDLIKAGQEAPGQFHLIQQFGLPQDFPTTIDAMSQYLKVLVFYRQE